MRKDQNPFTSNICQVAVDLMIYPFLSVIQNFYKVLILLSYKDQNTLEGSRVQRPRCDCTLEPPPPPNRSTCQIETKSSIYRTPYSRSDMHDMVLQRVHHSVIPGVFHPRVEPGV
jgi:hypothetical protein